MDGTPTQSNETRIATFKIPVREYGEIEDVAVQDERSVSAVLRLAVRQYLDARLGREKAA